MNYKMIQNKKAVSTIIATVLMIALVIAITGIVWVVVSNLVSQQLEEAGTCLDVIGKVSINHQYTCYNITGKELMFSIEIGDINISKVVVSVSGSGTGNSYEIEKTPKTITNLKNYSRGEIIRLADSNGALTYRLDTESTELGMPDSIRIYPVINGKQCDATDTLSEVGDCSLVD